MKKNFWYLISILVMMFLFLFTLPVWATTLLGLMMIGNFVWTVILLFEK